MKTIIKIKTWKCPECDYHQDFKPTQKLLNLHFPEGVEEDCCPACYLRRNPKRIREKVKMEKETNPNKKITITIMGEEDIETEIEEMEKDDGEKKGKKMTEAEKTVYRNKRKKDIVDAIKEAKKYEDKI